MFSDFVSLITHQDEHTSLQAKTNPKHILTFRQERAHVLSSHVLHRRRVLRADDLETGHCICDGQMMICRLSSPPTHLHKTRKPEFPTKHQYVDRHASSVLSSLSFLDDWLLWRSCTGTSSSGCPGHRLLRLRGLGLLCESRLCFQLSLLA